LTGLLGFSFRFVLTTSARLRARKGEVMIEASPRGAIHHGCETGACLPTVLASLKPPHHHILSDQHYQHHHPSNAKTQRLHRVMNNRHHDVSYPITLLPYYRRIDNPGVDFWRRTQNFHMSASGSRTGHSQGTGNSGTGKRFRWRALEGARPGTAAAKSRPDGRQPMRRCQFHPFLGSLRWRAASLQILKLK
jgi:hypothetical protein